MSRAAALNFQENSMNIVRTIRTLGAGAALLVASSAFAGSNDDAIVIASESMKSGAGVSLDLNSDGKTTAVSFVIMLPDNAGKLDLSKCASELPVSHKGECRQVRKDKLAVMIYSAEGKVLPAGIVPIGRFNMAGSVAKGGLVASKVDLARVP